MSCERRKKHLDIYFLNSLLFGGSIPIQLQLRDHVCDNGSGYVDTVTALHL